MEMSEWMRVMLEEIERKQAEEQAAREEQARRSQAPDHPPPVDASNGKG